jgi:hypothetical protein
MRDLANHIDLKRAISPAAATTDNTALVSTIADLSGYEGCMLLINLGALADADATFTVLMEDGDAANLSDAATVAATYLTGSVANANFTFAADNALRKIGYVGRKRYLRATITPANNTGNAFIAATWVLGYPRNRPTANPPA